MAGPTIFRSNLTAPALVVSTGGARSANLLLRTSAEAVFATGSVGAAVITSNRGSAARRLTSGGRRVLWIGAKSSPTVDRVVTRPKAPAAVAQTAQPAAPKPEPVEAASPEAAAAPAEAATQPAAAEPVEASPPAPESRPASKLELAIDSLPGYELVKPIPVIVESLGNKVFVAEVPDLDISLTGSSVSGVLLQLKDQIVRVYEGNRSKRNPDPERTRQLGKLESYIVKRRNWF
jgi:nucleoid-associated protein YgaU